MSDKLVYLQEEKILGEAYAIKYDTFTKDFGNSIFAYDADSPYAIEDEKLYNAILNSFENVKASKNMGKELQKIAENYVKETYKIICENAEFESKTEKVRVGGGARENARVINVILDGKAYSNIIADCYDYI